MFYIKHINAQNKYIIDTNAMTKSNVLKTVYKVDEMPLIEITSGDSKALQFVVDYLAFYANSNESPPPEFPLTDNLTIIEIFEYEKDIFNELLTPLEKQSMQNFLIYKNIVEIADELEMGVLRDKICAIICYYMSIYK